MIPVSEAQSHVYHYPDNKICDGATRKYIDWTVGSDSVRIYLHPVEPWFGASLDGTLYSFRRPMGPQYKKSMGSPDRQAGVNFGKPKVLKGHKTNRNQIKVSITPYLKRNKIDILNEIYRDKPPGAKKVGFVSNDELDMSSTNLYWK